MTETLVFDETLQKRKTSRLTKSIKYLSSTQSIVYALRHWGHVSQKEIANSLGCSQPYVKAMEDKARTMLMEEQFPWNKSPARKELIIPIDVSDGRLAPLKELTSLQAFVGALRLGLRKSQQEIAEIFDCTQTYVNFLEREGKAVLNQCEIVEIWSQIKIGSSCLSLSPRERASLVEQHRIQKEWHDTPEYKQQTALERREIHKSRQSESAIRYWKSQEGLAHKKKLSEAGKERQRQWLRKPRCMNKTEQQFQDILIQWGFLYKYWGDATIWVGIPAAYRRDCLLKVQGCRNPDFIHRFFPGIIELYGEFWHKEEKLENGGDNGQKKIDHYAIFGYYTLIIWEYEVKDAMEDQGLALNLYNKLSEFESKLRGEFRSEFGVDFPIQLPKFSNPA